MIYYLKGSEGYLKSQAIEKARGLLENPELCCKEYWEWSQDILEFISMPPFWGDRKLCILYFFPDSEAFNATSIWDGTDVYIVTAEIPDTRKKNAKALLKKCIVQNFEKVSEEVMMKSIKKRLSSRFGFTEEEILAVEEELKKAFLPYSLELAYDLKSVIIHVDMIGHSGKLDSETIQAFALESTSLKAFKLSVMILNQDNKCLDFARRLLTEQGESPIMLISVMLYQIRICYKAALYEGENFLTLVGVRSFQLYPEFKRYPVSVYAELHHKMQEAVNRIKSGEKNAEAVILEMITSCLLIEKGECPC